MADNLQEINGIEPVNSLKSRVTYVRTNARLQKCSAWFYWTVTY